MKVLDTPQFSIWVERKLNGHTVEIKKGVHHMAYQMITHEQLDDLIANLMSCYAEK